MQPDPNRDLTDDEAMAAAITDPDKLTRTPEQ